MQKLSVYLNVLFTHISTIMFLTFATSICQKGRRGKNKVLLTMIFRNTSFMLIFLMPDGTQKSVLAVFDHLTSLLGLETFRKIFPVILMDNGVEFKDPEALEYSSNGCPRTRLFIVILRHPGRNRRLKTIIA